MTASGKRRMQIDLTFEADSRLDALRIQLGESSKTAVVRRGLALLEVLKDLEGDPNVDASVRLLAKLVLPKGFE